VSDPEVEFDDLEQRVVALVARLPAARAEDEAEALRAMIDCAGEMRRLARCVDMLRLRHTLAVGDDTRVPLHDELRRAIHDLRTPTSVLYSYLQLISRRVMFPAAADAELAAAADLLQRMRWVRDHYD
jgi:hypothetical protein